MKRTSQLSKSLAMKLIGIFILMVFSHSGLFAQKIDTIYFNLYTDSLKKGTFNYINVEGRNESGKVLPLDTTAIRFESTAGTFFGNSLWIPWEAREVSVDIKAVLRQNSKMILQRKIYIKKKQ